MSRQIKVYQDKVALVGGALGLVLEQIKQAIAQRGQCSLVLAGGSTPKPLYEALAQQDLPWEKLHIFWGDERYVPPTHPDSNEGMAREAWLDAVDFPAANIHGMPTSAQDPQKDASRYEAELREFFGVSAGEFPVFDLILLGMGDDGHTASLFPQTAALEVCDRLITVGEKSGQPRLTFTIPLINQGRCVIFMVAGANKQPALQQVFAETADPVAYPSRFIQPQGELWWLLDEAAGTVLKSFNNLVIE
ncbi:6-phosphogluconolactonase [Spirulina subsalsa]|uniref:6-phosphogluconolactonase n=1 Tax=Spirulina subsalsa TaxID=54311 RepID=UPI00223701B5|nr:6-phosphogluconolactonase [Spirulina subsalsa]